MVVDIILNDNTVVIVHSAYKVMLIFGIVSFLNFLIYR